MANFLVGETAICSVEVRNQNNVLVNPISVTITISTRTGTKVNNATMLPPDSTGKYHYDYFATERGTFSVIFTATDGSRVSKTTDNFKVV